MLGDVASRAALDGQRALTGRGKHLQGVEHLGRLVQPAEPSQACPGQHDTVERTVGDLGKPGVDVAADRNHVQPEAQRAVAGRSAAVPRCRSGLRPAIQPG